MQDDAQGAVLDILDRIKTIDKDKQAGILSELFGTESITAIAPLLTNLDLLKGNLAKVGDASKYAGSMEGEYASRAATTANNLQLLRGSVMSVAREVGNALLPGINAVVDQLRPWISQVADLVRNNPQLVRGIVIAGAAFTALRAAVFAALVATRVLGVAFAATPIGLIAVGIAAAAGLIVANWGKVGPFFTALWDLIRAAAVPVMDMMKTFFAWTPLGQIVKNWEPISAWFRNLWEGIKPYIEPLIKFMGLEDGGPGITAKVAQMADAQKRRNAGEGGGTGDFLAANAGVKVKAARDQRAQQFGITPGALLKAPGQLPDPGSLLRQSSAAGKAQLDGEVRVVFDGAPAGMRVERATSSQSGVTVTPQNVGRRTMGGTNE